MEMAGIKPTLRAVLTTHAQSSNHTLDAYCSRRGIPTNVSMSAKMVDVVIRNGGSYQLSYTAYSHTISHMHA
ncbi:hypothetical protein YC2023_016495 [Brassica napus]